MIRYLKRHQIEDLKYNNCIRLAVNSHVYAYSWYLDSVADNWDALVLNDYEAVMPLPWRSKYFIKYIYPPAWTQQLGVFSENEIPEKLILDFIKAIPKKFLKVTIQFNSGNVLTSLKKEKRTNYILSLNKSYKEIYKHFRNDRKQRITQAKKEELVVKSCSFKDLETIAKQDYSFLKISDAAYKRLKLLTETVLKNKNGFLLGVYTKENSLLGGAIFLKDQSRIYYLFSVVTSEGKKQQAPSFLIDYVLKEYANSDYIFDFEGSMIPGIASFFKSFGANEEKYHFLQTHSKSVVFGNFFPINMSFIS